jgi:spore coat protein A
MFTRSALIKAAGFVLGVFITGSAGASVLVPQTPLPGGCIPQFAVPTPVFGPAGPIPRVDALMHNYLTVKMKEVGQPVLPSPSESTYNSVYYDLFAGANVACPTTLNIQNTRVWAYEISDAKTNELLGPAHWPAVTVETMRHVPTLIKYVNELPTFNPSDPTGAGLVQGLVTVDQTLHWAAPFDMCMNFDCTQDPSNICCKPYQKSPPAVAHLHGAEVISFYDGGPDAWFTPSGANGSGYSTVFDAGPGTAVYRYQNSQEPGTLWFHDHALGATRTNVYSGLATFYFIRDKSKEPKDLPSGTNEIELAIQTRQFDTNGQLLLPDGSDALCGSEGAGDPCLNGPPPNPDIHPFWNPEFIGDVQIVNGAPWPYLDVKPMRYRFRVLDGANARFYRLFFGDAKVYQIGSDDNYLDAPVDVSTSGVFIAPGERADIIVDFSGLGGQNITVTNDAPVPYPDGLVPGPGGDQPQMGQVMQFRVSDDTVTDKSCDPAAGQCTRPKPLVKLTDGNGNLAPGVKIDRVRQLVLKEVQGPGGPVEVLVNNTKWLGLNSPSIADQFPADGISELPREGSIELWEIINLTVDAHPMHTHLTQFQVLNRQAYDVDGSVNGDNEPNPNGYLGDDANPGEWTYAFGTSSVGLPNGCTIHQFCPGYGPPLPYNTPNDDSAIGGNPAISPYLIGAIIPPKPEETGWKDTAKSLPGQVLRLVIRWNPTDAPLPKNKSLAGVNMYPFDPTQGPGYVWHCHIIDHEDNEMMRPYKVVH